MTRDLFSAPLVPIASDEDARATCAAALPYVRDAGGRALFVYVVEKAGGAVDKASVEQREEHAEEAFDVVRDAADEAGVDVETDVLYGTDVGATIIDAAADHDASAIVFTPRGGSRWWDLFSGDVRESLVTESDRPVVVLPDSGESDEDGDGGDRV